MIEEQPTNNQSIEPPLEMMMKSLFNDFLEPTEITHIISRNSELLIELLSHCSSYFHQNVEKKHKRILTFLANYHKIVHLYALESETYLTNDIALHFINLLAYSRLKNNLVDEAKNIYKNIWTYVEIKSSDKLLLSIALNNLGFLHQLNNKYFKSLECHLKVVELMGMRLHKLKKSNKKHQLIEDSVILISSLVHCQKTLKCILSNQEKKENSFYYELFQYINEIGYKCSKKYLGEKSDFTKIFLDNCRNFEKLPVFFEQDQSVERTSLEQKILQQLEGIYEVLKTKREPEIIYVKEEIPQQEEIPPVIEEIPPAIEPSEESIIEPEPLPKVPEEEEMESSPQQSQTINGWNVTLFFLRSKELQNKITKEQFYAEFTPGTLVIECKKKKKQFKTILSPERLHKVLVLMNLEHSISSDYLLKNLSDDEFFNVVMFPHIQIEDDRNLEFLTRKRSLIEPIKFTFLEEESLIFLYHKEKSTFQVNISPANSSQSLTFDIEFSDESLSKLFSLEEKNSKIITETYEQIKEFNYKKQIEIPELKNYEFTQVTLIDLELVKHVISSILNDFENFILEVEQEDRGSLNFSDFLNTLENDEHDLMAYFAFNEINNPLPDKLQKEVKNSELILKGQFSLCKYLTNISSVEAFYQNNYKTFDLESQSLAKGTTMIYPDKFEKEFGISIKSIEKEGLIMSLLEMLAKRYELRVFYQHLRSHDEELYNQNAIYELPLICKSHKRSIVKDEDGFMIPVTISHLTVNGITPMAFRIDAYFPCEGGAQDSVLIKVRHKFWEKPLNNKENEENEENEDDNGNEENKEENSIYKPKEKMKKPEKEYFLAEWCELFGYDLMFKNIIIEDMRVKFKGSLLKFFSFERALHLIIKNPSE